MKKLKWYTITVLDDSKQSSRAIDIRGYSHMSQPYTMVLGMSRVIVRDVYIQHSNKAELTKEVKQALKEAFWNSINNPQIHHGESEYEVLRRLQARATKLDRKS